MRVAYFDCVSGISGNMALGAFLDAGATRTALRDTIDRLGLKGMVDLKVGRRTKLNIKATHVEIESTGAPNWRTIGSIEKLLMSADLEEGVRERSLLAFRLLASAEARAHQVAIGEVRLHETGALDAVIDVVGTFALADELGVEAFYSSALPLSRGVTISEHGEIPLPAPATMRILEAVAAPTYEQAGHSELVTPTGAAILGACATFETPEIGAEREGFGAGTSNLEWPNVLRVVVGDLLTTGLLRPAAPAQRPRLEAASAPLIDTVAGVATTGPPPRRRAGDLIGPRRQMLRTPALGNGADPVSSLTEEIVSVLETNIDDMAPNMLADLPERMLAAGALEAFITPVVMKKGRSAHLVTVICELDSTEDMAGRLIKETSTLGVRVREERRFLAGRRIERMESSLGPLNVKLKIVDGQVVDATPEYDDVRVLAAAAGMPLPDAHRRAVTEARSHYLEP